MVIYLGWFSRRKKAIRRMSHTERQRFERRYRKNKRYIRKAYNYTGTGRLMNNKYNQKYKVVGYTPDYMLSPIDAVPYLGPAAKGYRGYKYSRKTARAAVNTVKAGSREYSRRRGRSKSSRKGRRRRRGTYYYYRGKRIYRK